MHTKSNAKKNELENRFGVETCTEQSQLTSICFGQSCKVFWFRFDLFQSIIDSTLNVNKCIGTIIHLEQNG